MSLAPVIDASERLSHSPRAENSPRPQQTVYPQLLHDDSFRLFRFETKSPNSKPRLRLETFRLSDKPQYVAISYTWGPPTTKREILVNDCVVIIRQNLWDVLQSLIHHQQSDLPFCKDAYFFVDAICIAQDSPDEKNQQVSHIDQVFGTAVRVFAYVGSSEWIEQAIRDYNPDDPQPFHRRIRDAPYWMRTWIIQELALAQKVVLFSGKASFTLDDKGIYVLPTGDPNKSSPYEQVMELRQFQGPRIALEGRSMFDLLDRFRASECEVPLDKVFALQSLAEPHLRCKVNYRTTPIALFWEVLMAGTTSCGYKNAGIVAHALRIPLAEAFHNTLKATPEAGKPSILVYTANTSPDAAVVGPGRDFIPPPNVDTRPETSEIFAPKVPSHLNTAASAPAQFIGTDGSTWILTHGTMSLSDYLICYRWYLFPWTDLWPLSTDHWVRINRNKMCFVVSASTHQICGILAHSELASSKLHLMQAFDDCWQQSTQTTVIPHIDEDRAFFYQVRLSPLLFAACCGLDLEQKRQKDGGQPSGAAKMPAPVRNDAGVPTGAAKIPAPVRTIDAASSSIKSFSFQSLSSLFRKPRSSRG
jgi:hypothetical protein